MRHLLESIMKASKSNTNSKGRLIQISNLNFIVFYVVAFTKNKSFKNNGR